MPNFLNRFQLETPAMNERQLTVRSAGPTASSSLASRIASFFTKFAHRDPRLIAVQNSLNSRAKDVAGCLIRINMSLCSVSRALLLPGFEDASAVWKRIAEDYHRLLRETRQLASLASSDVTDFLDSFYPYLRKSHESVDTKMKQVSLYSKKLEEKRDKAKQISVGLLQVNRDISAFLEGHRLKNPSISGGAKAAKCGIEGLIETHMNLGNDIATILDNATFPGVMSSTTALCPAGVSKDLNTLIEGDARADLGCADGLTRASKMNLLDNLVNFWRILRDDLLAANKASQTNVWFVNPSGAKDYQSRIDVVLKVYSMFGIALRELHKALADPQAVLAQESRGRLLRRTASVG